MASSRKRGLEALAAVAGFAVLAILIGLVLYHNGTYPGGIDTLCHIYKGDVLYRNIQQGTLWPYYDPLWYNGVEMMRYWAPLPVYAFAGCEALAGGNPLTGFVIFCGAIFFIGACSWYYVGTRLGRRGLGCFVGILWFFMPNNLIALFYEGNLPRCIVLALIPALIFQVWDYLKRGTWQRVGEVGLLFALMVLCHSGFAGMVLIALIIYFIFWGIANRNWKRGMTLILAMGAGYLICGIWLVPSLIGGITSTNSSEIMEGFFQSFWLSIDPVARLTRGNIDFYFGLAAFIVCVIGLVCSKRDSFPGFAAAIAILLLTTKTAYPALAALPGGQYLWMLRFVSIALAFMLFSLMVWKTLRKGVLVLLCALLVADCLPSLPLVVGTQDGSDPLERMEAVQDWTLVKDAQDITTQRLALIDGSALDSESAYIVTGMGKRVAMSEGAAWQSASTATNFMQLDRAAQQGGFLYLFDRALELGDDSVLVRTKFVNDWSPAAQLEMDAAAGKLGYVLKKSTGLYRLYHLDGAPATWGVKSSFDAIGIGSDTAFMSLEFPGIEETSDADLNHYTFDELKNYKTVYLGGFTYDDQASAERLVQDLADAGVRIVISSDGMPVNKNSHDRVFLGVRANDVTFSNGYPELQTTLGKLDCKLFPEGMRDWHTTYVEGLDDAWGTFETSDSDTGEAHELPFLGTAKSKNIVFCGLNLGYFYSVTKDQGAGRLLDLACGMSGSELPKREIVPLTVDFEPDQITVTSPEDDVDTTLAYHDEFANDGVAVKNHLVHVGKGTTHLTFEYPYLWQGVVTSIAGAALLFLLAAAARRASLPPAPEGEAGDAPVALLIPAYEPDGKLLKTLQEVVPDWSGPIVVVNDGSGEACDAVFAEVRAMDGVMLLAHGKNRGKGAALKTGISWVCHEHPECVGVVTADADGQHEPADIRNVADALRRHPDRLVLGVRDFTRPDVPRRSCIGNKVSSVLLNISVGVKVSDTQTGLRGIPLGCAPWLLKIGHDRYEFETDMLAAAHREGVEFLEVPIATVYIGGNESSHYRPVADSMRIAAVFFRYAASSASSSIIDLGLFGALAWWLPGAVPAVAVIPVATFAARVASAAVNFAINRHLVFKTRGSAARYLVVCLVSTALSAALVAGIVGATGWDAVAVKIAVDVVLFFGNYALQRAWVFASGESSELARAAA